MTSSAQPDAGTHEPLVATLPEVAAPTQKQRPIRRTQQERSSATRARLLDATIDALVELGYSATTTTVIADRAGVSRGAQQNHYPTKAGLVAAAVEHLAGKLLKQIASDFAEVPASDPVDFAIDALWSSFSAPLLSAWVELSVAARTDDELRATLEPVEARLQGEIAQRVYLSVGESVNVGQALLILTMTLCLFEGITLERATRSTGRSAFADLVPVMIDTWKTMVRRTFPDL